MTINSVHEIETGYNGHWGHVFQGANTQWLSAFEQRIIAGSFFFTLQSQSAHIFDAQIPQGSKILSATQRVQAHATSGAGVLNMPMNTPNRIGHAQLPLKRPFEAFRGWRPDMWSNQNVSLISDTFQTITQPTGGVSNASWIVKQLIAPTGTIGNRDEMAQGFTTSGVHTLGFVTYFLTRTGNPTGSCRIRIEGTKLVLGQREPDGNVLAVSDDVLASSIPTSPATGSAVSFVFSGADRITLADATEYFLIFESDYPVLTGNYISIRHENQFLSAGRLMHYGDGLGGDWQNYAGTVDFNQAFHTTELGADVIWPLPQFIQNQNYTSPDISALVQAQVDAPWYTQDAGIIISNQTIGGTLNRRWKSAFYPIGTGQQPRLTVSYIPPDLDNPKNVGLVSSVEKGKESATPKGAFKSTLEETSEDTGSIKSSIGTILAKETKT